MNNADLYKKAMKEMQELAKDVLEQCVEFAEEHDYEKEWVIERFQEQFARVKDAALKNRR